MSAKKFLGIITARAGSKGIKNKNIKSLNGRPLLVYSIAAARQSRLLTDCVVSTDSTKFAKVAQGAGGKVPFLRPARLAEDKTPTVPVLQHTLLEYEKTTGQHFDYVVLLQPTSPLRLAKDIDAAIQKVLNNPAKDNLVSCYRSDNIHPKKMYTVKGGRVRMWLNGHDGAFRRQDVEEVFIRNGAVYIIRRDLLLKGRMFGDCPLILEMPRLRSVDIDSMEDWTLAELILQKKGRL